MRQPAAERERHVHEQCPDDPALREEVLAILRSAATQPPGFLDPPPRPAEPGLPSQPYDPANDLLIGYRLCNRYMLRQRIGEGGMSVVYEGLQDHPSRRVAVKIMRPGAFSPRFLRRFQKEPDILARLDH